MSIRLTFTAALAALMTTGTALASPGYGHDRGYHQGQRGDDDDDRDEDYRYGGYNGDRTEYAQVLEARPIYRQVQVSTPRQECHDERVVYRDGYNGGYGNYSDREVRVNNAVGAVIGGVIGGAAGHQFSRGSGRQVATAIGAVIGSQIGQNVVRDNYDRGYDRGGYREHVTYEPRCTSYTESRYEQRAEGYDVTYRYHGQVYHTVMPYDPGNRLAVNVNVSPVRY